MNYELKNVTKSTEELGIMKVDLCLRFFLCVTLCLLSETLCYSFFRILNDGL